MKKVFAFALVLVMALSVVGCGTEEAAVQYDLIPSVMVDGVLYVTTGYTKTYIEDDLRIEGEITSEVPSTEVPTENDQSNFGTGYSYRHGSEGVLELYLDNSRWALYATEEMREHMSFPESMLPFDWGLVVDAKDVTPTGLTLVFSQKGGAPTGELGFGSDYSLEVTYDNNTWEQVLFSGDNDIAWTAELYTVTMDGTTEQTINWEGLYGKLPAGRYRLLKTVQDFRGPGDKDEQTYYAEFVIGIK